VTGNGWSTTDATTATGWENQAMFDLNDEALPVVGAYAAR
jgi:arabinogalactan endo-1,4-beta-galactosidase